MSNIDFAQSLSKNFKLHEVTDWANNISGMSKADRDLAIKLARETITLPQVSKYRKLCGFLQIMRDLLNRVFPQFSGQIKITITSAHRPRAWETHRGRVPGKNGRRSWSEHVSCAIDWVVEIAGATTKEINEVMDYAWGILQNWNGGLARKMSGSRWSFIHQDFGRQRRWTY